MELSKKINPLKKLILILSAIGFMSCNDEPTGNSITTPTMPSTTIMENFGNQINSDFMGRVVDPQYNPISGAMIQIGNSTTDTDSNGVFILKNIQVYEKFAYIKVEKPGFLHGSRSLVPTSGINKVKIMLLPQTVTETVSSGIAETVSLANGASVDLAGAYAKSDGTEYNGDIQVTLHFLNPTDENMEQQMPGMLLAQNIQNEARMLETLGMLAVELRGDNGEKLNLLEGTTATISIPLDPETLAIAPNEIPLWYFDEDNGYWIEEGSATLQGTKYVGTVSHFSFWNCDIPAEYIILCLNVTDVNNNQLGNILINIESEQNGSRNGITNEDGEVCGIVPANQILNLKYYYYSLCNNPGTPNSAGSIGPLSQDTTLDIVLDSSEVTEQLEVITGVFNTCDGSAVVNGYVEGSLEGGAPFYSIVTDGVFEINILSCYEDSTLSITGYDYDNLQTTGEIFYTLTSPETDLGVLSACDSIEEFIQYSIDGGETLYFFENINVTFGPDENPPTLTVYGSSNDNTQNCFYIYGFLETNYANYEGVYNNIDWNSSTPGFTLNECQDISNTNNFIQYNLSSFGSAIGEYIDINFGGDYEDYQGVSHTISGVIHVKRDN